MNEAQWLLGEFKRRKANNPAYSLRAFSRAVKVAPGRLSEYLSGKRPLSAKMAGRIATELGMAQSATVAFTSMEEEAFSVVADWQHFAILSLMDTRNFQSKEGWIARRLGISVLEVREALSRLHRTGLAEKKDGAWVPTPKNLTTSEDIASAALRRSHRQSLEQAARCLEEVPVELRDISSVTMAIDVRNLPLAKIAIRDFRRRLMRLLESGDRSEVFNLNIQLVPLTKKEKEI